MKNKLHITTILLTIALLAAGCGKKDESANNSGTETITSESAEAQRLNESGMEYYKKKDYTNAATEFEKAIKADPKHKLANYNLACTYALMFNECEVFPRESDIFNQLKKAAELDPNVKTKAPKDSDFKNFNKSTRFLDALGLLPEKSDNNGWKNIMTSQKGWNIGNCGGGVYTSQCDGITFNEDGTFVKSTVNRECMHDMEENEACKDFDMSNPYVDKPGKYEIKNQKAILKFDSGKTEEMSLPIPEHDGDPCGA